MRKELATPDLVVARIAACQHNLITTARLLSAGINPAGITRRVRSGRLRRIHRGVYAIGLGRLNRVGTFLAACLALGPEAALSHDSAAELERMAPLMSSKPIHVTIPGDGGRAERRGIVVHRSKTLGLADVTRVKGIPVTTISRTQRDLGLGTEPTRSEMERLFLSILRGHHLPPPEVNAKLGPYEPDCLWRAEKLVAVLDSWAWHRSRASFESDRARDRELTLRGYTVIRFTWWELVREPERVAGTVGRLLRR